MNVTEVKGTMPLVIWPDDRHGKPDTPELAEIVGHFKMKVGASCDLLTPTTVDEARRMLNASLDNVALVILDLNIAEKDEKPTPNETRGLVLVEEFSRHGIPFIVFTGRKELLDDAFMRAHPSVVVLEKTDHGRLSELANRILSRRQDLATVWQRNLGLSKWYGTVLAVRFLTSIPPLDGGGAGATHPLTPVARTLLEDPVRQVQDIVALNESLSAFERAVTGHGGTMLGFNGFTALAAFISNETTQAKGLLESFRVALAALVGVNAVVGKHKADGLTFLPLSAGLVPGILPVGLFGAGVPGRVAVPGHLPDWAVQLALCAGRAQVGVPHEWLNEPLKALFGQTLGAGPRGTYTINVGDGGLALAVLLRDIPVPAEAQV